MTSRFHNQSDAYIADLIGELDCQTKALEKAIKEAKDELLARGIDKVEGEKFNVTRAEYCRWTLNKDAVVEKLGEPWVTQNSKITPVTSFRITVRRDALVDAE